MNLYAYAGGNPVNWIDENALLFGGHIDAGELYGDSAAQYWAEKYIRVCFQITASRSNMLRL